MSARGELLWSPPDDALVRSRLGQYRSWLVEVGRFLPAADVTTSSAYEELWRWSVEDPSGFWTSIAAYFGILDAPPSTKALADATMPGARWFPGTTLNYAAHALRRRDSDRPAVVARSDTRPAIELSWEELASQVARCRAGLQRAGVGRSDRVAAYLPNIPEATIALLATASLGAIWSSCPPEFGTQSVVDRFRQIEPSVLLAVDGYRYGEKELPRRDEVAAIRAELPDLRATVTVPYLDQDARLEGSLTWDELLDERSADATELEFEDVPFDHPLYVLYSSGTTGLPKPIIHGHGGILLEHCKALGLHGDLGPGDRFFWFSTTGWMMWNYLNSGLLVGASIVLFDGDPGHPDLGKLWRLAGDLGVTYFGVSAPFLLACRKNAIHPKGVADLVALRSIGSTGAPLPAEGFRWVYDELGPDLLLSSISGGTDMCTAFVGGSPLSPVRAGEISTRYLGAKVEAYDATSHSVIDEEGELVITAPMPSMPVGFWGDEDGSRYRAAYFEGHPGVWTHGDWITVREDGSCQISGRSDATLNRGGVRMGTAELYSVVEALPEVADSLVIHQEDPEGGAGRLVLFVVPAPGVTLDDGLRTRLASELRTQLSPRHVPDEVHQVGGVPRTLSGKKLEVPVKRILGGAAPDKAASRGSLANPEALDAFVRLSESEKWSQSASER